MNRTAVGLATGAVAIAILTLYILSEGGERREVPATIAKTPPITNAPTRIGEPSAVAVAPSPPIAKMAPRATPLYKEFEEASDIKGFVDKLGRRPAGADEKAYVALALSRCQRVAQSGSVERMKSDFASEPKNQKSGDPNVGKRTQLFNQATDRCIGFAGDVITTQEIRELERAAAKGGSALGKARTIFEIDDRGLARPRSVEAMREILQSRDPVAIRELAGAAQLIPLITIDGFSRTDLAGALEPAWTMVACDLGLACGPDSSLAAVHCIYYDWCDGGTVDTFYQRALPERTFQTALQLRGLIGTAIVRRDWRALGLN